MNPRIRSLLHRRKPKEPTMKLLNLACGSVRPPSTESVQWSHVDQLLPTLGEGSPEWNQLLSEPDYSEHDVTNGRLAFEDGEFDSAMCSHFIEHVDCQQAVTIMRECLRVLKPGGILLVSVPDAKYFRSVHDKDTVENAQELFGEPIHLPDGETTFFGYALWNRWHKAILTEDVLWHYFRRAGFKTDFATWRGGLAAPHWTCEPEYTELFNSPPCQTMIAQLNRLKFSLCMMAVKE